LINEENNFKMKQKWPKSQNRIYLLTVWRAGSVLETALGVFGATLKRVEAARPTAFSILEVVKSLLPESKCSVRNCRTVRGKCVRSQDGVCGPSEHAEQESMCKLESRAIQKARPFEEYNFFINIFTNDLDYFLF
jgi:hypothetical protein